MKTQGFRVICKQCKKSERIALTEDDQILWGMPTYIISGRKRLDGQWGFQCFCGNDTLLTKQERNTIKDLQNPAPKDIKRVIDNLVVENDTRFIMEKL